MTATPDRKLLQLQQHTWPTTEYGVARFTITFEAIAVDNSLTLEAWDENGLGTMRGCCGRLPSGVVIMLMISDYMVSTGKVRGPDLYADATDVHRLGVDRLLQEALDVLGLTESDVEWKNPNVSTGAEIASLLRGADEIRRRRAAAPGQPPQS